MISVVPFLTRIGQSMLVRAAGGEAIVFTRYKLGDGTLPQGEDGSGLQDLIHTQIEFPITDIQTGEGTVTLTGSFDSSNITSDFHWREMGLFCKGEDEVEMLYAYANSGEDAGLLRALDTDILTEQTVETIVAIGNAENVTAIVAPKEQYATKNELNDHKGNKANPHAVTAEQIGLGSVVNAAPRDMEIAYTMPENAEALTSGEKLHIALGKIARLITSAITHMNSKENPHEITADKIQAAKATHQHIADDINSGQVTIEHGGTGVGTLEGLKNLIGTNAAMSIYSGDGVDGRVIAVGFRPSAVILCNSRGATYDVLLGVCGGVALGSYGLRGMNSESPTAETEWVAGETALLITDNGFQVGYAEDEDGNIQIGTNTSGEGYRYIAYR